VIANIVENALRHAPLDQTVRVSASRYADTIELRVIDRGPGIAPTDRQIVFEPFQRRDNLATSAGPGVGLGLAIARGFIEAMHGSISLEDTSGGGLTVSIAIPLTASTSSEPYRSASSTR
jgi:two-component system sensor histidine kinase KdpD